MSRKHHHVPPPTAGQPEWRRPAPPAWLTPTAGRRRNLAIIAHPDAGKTTLTEKLLLYGGAVQQAGAVRTRADQRAATSDWMELEQERGISITSTVLSFDFMGKHINLLDTPGHQDFSEDTYRTLAAADNAVCLVDAAKGLEPQTRKLMEVAKRGRQPIFTFCNKMDRPALAPFELIDQVDPRAGAPPNCPIHQPTSSHNHPSRSRASSGSLAAL